MPAGASSLLSRDIKNARDSAAGDALGSPLQLSDEPQVSKDDSALRQSSSDDAPVKMAYSGPGRRAIPVAGIVSADYDINRHNRRDMKEIIPTTESLEMSYTSQLQVVDPRWSSPNDDSGVLSPLLSPPNMAGGVLSPSSGSASLVFSQGPFQGQSIISPSIYNNLLTESTVAHLPRSGRPSAEKPRGEATPSPMFEHLKTLPGPTVAADTAVGQALRMKLLRGSVVVVMSAGYSGKRFVYEEAKRCGVHLIMLDGPESWSRALVEEGIVAKFVPIDMSDADTVFERSLEAIRSLRFDEDVPGEPSGICSFCELAIPLVARLAEALGLPGNSSPSVDAARDKHATRRIVMEAGLPSVRHAMIRSPSDIETAAAHVGFPAVIKPIHGAASLGVVRVNDEADLRKGFERVEQEMGTLVVSSGALLRPEEAKGNDHTHAPKMEIMMEEYLDGDEVDIDLVLSEGRAVYHATTDNWPTVEPWFNETGSNCPSLLSGDKQAELVDLAISGCAALGLTTGVFHVEGKYTSRGPRLIEVNCRMGGGPVRDVNLLVWGVDLVQEHFMTVVGIPVRPQKAPAPLRHIGELSINASRSGYVAHTDFLEKWQGADGVLEARPLVSPWEKVTGAGDGLPTWICELVVEAGNVEEACKMLRDIEAEMEQPIVEALPLAAMEKKGGGGGGVAGGGVGALVRPAGVAGGP